MAGTPTELHTELENIAIGKLKFTISKIKSWPKTASHLTRRINRIKTNLREKGIEITLGRGEKSKRTITVSKVPYMPSMASKTTESSTNQKKKFDSKSDNAQVPSNMPSNENSEKQPQKSTLDSMYGIDGTLQTEKEEQELKKETSNEKYQREQEEQKTWGKGLE